MTAFAFVAAIWAQSNGRFEDTKRAALGYLDSGQYDRAAGKLEEIWEQDQSDPQVAENLAIAYLNGQDRLRSPDIVNKAEKLIEKTLQDAGAAAFLVQHSHEKFSLVGPKVITNYCSGRLTISSSGKITYVATARKGIETHSFDLSANDVRISGPDGAGSFTIKTREKNYVLIPLSRVNTDGGMIVTLLHRYVAAQQQKGE